jgi:hypothetical protein
MDSSRRKIAVQLIVYILRGILAVVVALAGIEVALRLSHGTRFAPFQPCTAIRPDLHHFYSPNCVNTVSVDGREVVYRFNERGMRDAPMAEIPAQTIAVLGDSEVKGLFLNSDGTLPSHLNRELRERTGYYFLNLGNRFSSPTIHAALLKNMRQAAGIKGVVWLINGTDPIEERLYAKQVVAPDKWGLPRLFETKEIYSEDFFFQLRQALPFRLEILDFWLRRNLFSRWSREIAKVKPDRDLLCSAILAVGRYGDAIGLPILYVFTPKTAEGLERSWLNEKYDPGQLNTMIECARSTNHQVVDLTGENLDSDAYFDDLVHYREKGITWLSEKLRPRILELVERIKKADKQTNTESGSKPKN